MTQLSEKELRARFAFWRVSGVGPALMAACLQEFGSIEKLFEEKKNLPEALKNFLDLADWRGAEKDLAWLACDHHHLLLLGEGNFPKALAEISQAPPFLFVKGDANLLLKPQLAIVGSRNPTPYGAKAAQKFASEIASAGLIVTSGLALGIDSLAHQAVVDLPQATIAVLAVGLDQVYPKRHQKLAELICEKGGALVSEYGVGTQAVAENFPRRNRIISGLSLGTLVVEATIKSGSLITAQYAAEQGREVFAIPGSIFQTLSQGCHHLIQQGASCVWEAQQILDQLAWSKSKGIAQPERSVFDASTLSSEEQALLALLHEVPQSLEALQENLLWPIERVQSVLSSLLLRGAATRSWAGVVRA